MKGVPVTFVLLGGDGSIGGDPVVTNDQGIAKLSAWTLGKRSRVYTVHARSQPLDIQFDATALPGIPARMEKIAGDDQVASESTSVPLRPTVKVTDEFGNATAGVTVDFAIASGGGRIDNDRSISDALGAASPGVWTVGSRGPQSLVASAGSLGSTTFVATAIGGNSVCEAPDRLPPDVQIRAFLTNSSCVTASGEYFSWYSIDITTASAWYFLMRSPEFDPYLELRDTNGKIVASNKNRDWGDDALLQAMLVPGNYTLVTTTSSPQMLGSYSLKYFASTFEPNGCEGMYVMKGTSLSTSLTAGVCPTATHSSSAVFRIYLTEGASIDVRLQDRSYSGPDFEISTTGGAVLTKGIQVAPYDDAAVFTAPASGVYVIRVYSDYEDGFEYTVDFQ